MRDNRSRVRGAALFAGVAATVPYLLLKLMWLSGSRVGMTVPDDLHEMSSRRFVAGNTITILLMAVAASFIIALTRSWADRVPAQLVFVLGAGATGLLAPILVGLPVGVAVQAVATDDVGPAPGTGLAPWVFAVVYSGFAVLGLALAVLVIFHVLDRWGSLISQPSEAALVAIHHGWSSRLASFWRRDGLLGGGRGGGQRPAGHDPASAADRACRHRCPECGRLRRAQYVEPGSSVAATCLAGDLDGVLCHGISRSHARPALPGRQG